MSKQDRKPRDKPKNHKDLSAISPIKFLNLGGKDDPCFGKLYSLKSKICRRCGDCEVCAIVTSQNGFVKQIQKQNSKGAWLDLEEAELTDKQDLQMKKYLLKKFKANEDRKVSIKKTALKFIPKFNLQETDLEYISQRLIKVAQDSNLKLNNKLTLVYGRD